MAFPTTIPTSIVAGTATATGSLAAGATLINSLSNLLLASPQTTQGYQPQGKPPAAGLISFFFPSPSILFHYEGEQTCTFQSDITDHYVEDNTALQDQIALKPVVITTHGFIGELNNVPPLPLLLLQQSANTLTSISAYTPALSSSALLAYNEAFAAYQLAQSVTQSAVSAVTSLAGLGGESVINSTDDGDILTVFNQNRQQTCFQQFYGYWTSRTLFTVQTPWAVFKDMAILSLKAVQDGETRVITDFEVTFKQINFASSAQSVSIGTGRSLTQKAPSVNTGTGARNPASVPQGRALTGTINGG